MPLRRSSCAILSTVLLTSGSILGGCSTSAKSGEGAQEADSGAQDATSGDAAWTGMSPSDAAGPAEGGDSGEDAGAADAAGKADACINAVLAWHVAPGSVVVVFDQSDSMTQPFDPADGGTAGPKWKVATDAVAAGFASTVSELSMGAIFFPTKATGNVCSTVDPIGTPPQIPLEPGASFVSDFQAHFSAPGWTTILGTPTVAALTNTEAVLPEPSPSPGPRTVVLVTDGAPTCDTKQADVVAPVASMAARGIKTYVLGLPGSTAVVSFLNAVAAAGGTGVASTPADPSAFEDAVSQIAASSFDPCTLVVNPPAADPAQVHLVVTDASNPGGAEVPRGDAGDAWMISADGATVTLLGDVCTKEKAGAYTSLLLASGCGAAR